MYQQFNRATGRLIAVTNLQSPLFPVSPAAVQHVEPLIQYTSSQMSTVSEGAACAPKKQRLVPGTNVPFAPVSEKLRREQEKFLKEDGVPVHLKGGIADVILYRLTLGLCGVGLLGIAEFLYKQANKSS